MDDLLLGAWDSLPDAIPTELNRQPVAKPLADARKPLPKESADRGSNPSPIRTRPPTVEALPIARPQIAVSRPVAFEPPPVRADIPRPSSSARFPVSRTRRTFSPSIDEIKTWGSGAVAIAALILVSYWGVSSVSGSSGSSLATISVQGKVTLNGKSVPGANIQLHPVQSSETQQGQETSPDIRPRGLVGPDSQVEFTTYQPNDGVPVGEYVATISYMQIKVVDGETVAGPQLAPDIYTHASTSPLRVKVSSDTRVLPPLAIKKPSRAKPVRYEPE